MIVCAFIVTPLVVIRRSRLSPAKVWPVSLPVLFACHLAGWILGPALFMALLGDIRLPELHADDWKVLCVSGLIYSLVGTAIVYGVKCRDRRKKREHSARVQQAIARIKADGVVEGPKGPYVPHRPWSRGRTGTPATTGEYHGQCYGMPMH